MCLSVGPSYPNVLIYFLLGIPVFFCVLVCECACIILDGVDL